MEERVTFESDGLKLSGVLHTPEGRDPRERRPALLVLHGFGSNKNSEGSTMEFPFEVVESMYAFRANDVVGKIAPRPLLLLHSANDSVTPTEQSADLFAHAGQPTDLHLMAGVDHFMFAEGNPLVINLVHNWLDKYLPLRM